MTTINAKDVMALRAATGLGMMDCKEALAATGGDRAAAEDYLRKKLKGKMELRTDRAAGEGCITVAVSEDGKSAAIAEIRAETDFTAKNKSFVEAANKVAQHALAGAPGMVEPTADMLALIENVRITTGENASIARIEKITGGAKPCFGAYVHHDGKTGAVIVGEGEIPETTLKDIAMHVVAATPRPQGVKAEDIPAAFIEKERKFAVEQAVESGKPQEIAEKMVEGRIRKLYEELTLMEQPFVKNPDLKIKDLIPKGATLTAFRRWQLGESA